MRKRKAKSERSMGSREKKRRGGGGGREKKM